MAFVSIKILGVEDTIRSLQTVSKRIKDSQDNVSEAIAKDLQKGIRQRVSGRLNKRTGNLRNSVVAYRVRDGIWSTKIGGSHVPYAKLQEEGGTIQGWHFVQLTGFGRHSEGVSRPGGQIRIPAHNFVKDSIESTKTRLDSIIKRELNKVG